MTACFTCAIGAAGFINLYLAINIDMSTRSVWRTGNRTPRGHIVFCPNIHFEKSGLFLLLRSSLYEHCSFAKEKKICFVFFFFFPGQTTACPDMLSALGIGSGMCIGLLTETYTKYLSTGYLSGTFPASVLVKRPRTIVLFWNGSASWVNGASNSHKLSKFTAAFVQNRIC